MLSWVPAVTDVDVAFVSEVDAAFDVADDADALFDVAFPCGLVAGVALAATLKANITNYHTF